jgi:hypothetical protein
MSSSGSYPVKCQHARWLGRVSMGLGLQFNGKGQLFRVVRGEIVETSLPELFI